MSRIEWTEVTVARFWSYVDRRGPEECWVWKAGCFKGGYGQFRLGKRKVKAHRCAYELSVGPIPIGLRALHHCDNPPCCNPAHLYVGTEKDNARDRVERGGQARLRGESNPQAKLTAAEIGEVRALAAAGGATYREIGARYGLHYNSVGRIVRRERWA